jgi:hypothetical protein
LPVQNFLEDEEYESQNIDSAVPDFLQDEEYEHTGGDEYYGGGFTDGNSEGGASGSLEDGFFGSYGDEDDLEETGDEELFEGGELFGADAEDGEPGAESSSYGISGITLPGARPVVTPVDTVFSPVAPTAPSTTIPTSTSSSGAPVDGSTTGAIPPAVAPFPTSSRMRMRTAPVLLLRFQHLRRRPPALRLGPGGIFRSAVFQGEPLPLSPVLLPRVALPLLPPLHLPLPPAVQSALPGLLLLLPLLPPLLRSPGLRPSPELLSLPARRCASIRGLPLSRWMSSRLLH